MNYRPFICLGFLMELLLSSSAALPESPNDPNAWQTDNTSCPVLDSYNDGRSALAEKVLEPAGLNIGLYLTNIYQQNTHGGLSTHHHGRSLNGSYELHIDGNLDKLAKINDAGFFIMTEGSWNNSITDADVGSYFSANGDAYGYGDRSVDITQCWYEQGFGDEGELRLRIGKIDLTWGFTSRDCLVAFDNSAYANNQNCQFLNNALINNPTIPFSDYGLGAVLHFTPIEWWYVSLGSADGQADMRETGFHIAFHDEDFFFSIFETGITPLLHSPRGPMPGAYRLGTWYDPQDKQRTSGSLKRDDMGLYFSGDQMIYKENADTPDAEDKESRKDNQGLGLFARCGWADSDVNEVTHFWSAGVQYQGVIPCRDDDVIALGLAQGFFSDLLMPEGRDAETVVEFYYNALLHSDDYFEMTLTPSVQQVIHPNGSAQAHDAAILGLRLQMAF